ncbi:MAG: hypothetical protein QOH93_2682 [Chloroflexia bacterium]|nr:hypothetical protein [Chloroflexia bacterium]
MHAIETLFQHNLWANLKVINACRDLDDAVLDASVPGTYGSIRATLTHIVRAEGNYLRRLSGQQPDRSGWGEVPTLDQIRAGAQHTGEALIRESSRVQPSDMLQVEWEGETGKFPASIVLLQAINHATEHRTHINTILTQQGITPPDVDGWSYMWAIKAEEQKDA